MTTAGYPLPSELPYDFEGDAVSKARVKFSGTTDVADVLHRGDRIVIVSVGEVGDIGHGVHAKRLTRQQSVALDAVYVVTSDDKDVNALVERLRGEAIKKADELEGRIPLPLDTYDVHEDFGGGSDEADDEADADEWEQDAAGDDEDDALVAEAEADGADD